MKLYVEFVNQDSKDYYIDKLKKKDFETSLNIYGTLLIKFDFVSFAENVLTIEKFDTQKEIAIYLKDVSYFEIQK